MMEPLLCVCFETVSSTPRLWGCSLSLFRHDDDDDGHPPVRVPARGRETVAGEIDRDASFVVGGEEIGIVDFANTNERGGGENDDIVDDDGKRKRRSSSTTLKTRKSSTSIDVHEFSRPFLNRKECAHRFTSVAGHVRD